MRWCKKMLGQAHRYESLRRHGPWNLKWHEAIITESLRKDTIEIYLSLLAML